MEPMAMQSATATTKISFEEALAAYNHNNMNNTNKKEHPITSSQNRNAHTGQNDKTTVPPFPPSLPPRPRKVAFAMASVDECTRDLPEHIQELLVFEDDPEDRYTTEAEAACDRRKTVLNNMFRCQYCYQFYDHVRQWVPPWQDMYRLRCNRHRDKSFLYWCKSHQRGFPSKRAVADYCNSTTTTTTTTTMGGVLGYSWSYHQSDDIATECVNANYHQRESLTYQDRRTQMHTQQKHTRTQNPFVSWTYQQDTTTDDQRGCDIAMDGLRLFGTSSSSSSSSSKIKNKNKNRNTD